MGSRLVAFSRAARIRWAFGVGLSGACAMLAHSALQVRAEGVPVTNPLVYSGILEEGAEPVSGSRSIGLSLYDSAAEGVPQCALSPAPVQVDAGRFSLVLGDACAQAVRKSPDLWVELQVEGTILVPRTKLAAVPYALEAGRAADASGALRDELNATKNVLTKVMARVAKLEQKSRPRVLLTRDTRDGCPAPYAPGTDMVAHSFVTAGPATIQVSGNMIGRTTGRQDLYLFVDGVEVDRTLASPNGPGGDNWVGMYVEAALDVGPGNHTVSLRGSVADIYGCHDAWGHIHTVIFE